MTYRRYFRLRSSNLRRDLDDEIETHIAMRVEDLVRCGETPERARALAIERFGNIDDARRRLYASATRREDRMKRRETIDAARRDVVLGLRRLRRDPGFAMIAILTLALGIGANAAIFSVLSAVLLRPLPYAEPDRVMSVWVSIRGAEQPWLSAPEVLDYQKGTPAFAAIAAYHATSENITGEGAPERVAVSQVTRNMFDALGLEPLLGRRFTAEEDAPNGRRVVAIGYDMWRQRYNGDPAVLGRTIRVNGAPATVVAVLPKDAQLPMEFRGDPRSALWMPLALNLDSLGNYGSRHLYGVARLAPGATVETANAQLAAVVSSWEFLPEAFKFAVTLIPVEQLVFGKVRLLLYVLLGAVGFVLLIACANVANLLLARADDRRREIAVRTSLGAGRTRLLTQLITESMIIALAGGLAGIGLAFAGVEGLVALRPVGIPRIDSAAVDGTVLLATLGLTILTGLIFGVGPAMQLVRSTSGRGSGLVDTLKEGGRAGTAGRNRQQFRRLLVVSEIALSVVLLIGATLMIRSFIQLQRIDLGYSADNVLTLRLSLPSATYDSPESIVRYYAEVQRRMEALPGVHSAGLVRVLPLTAGTGQASIAIEDAQNPHVPQAEWQIVTPGYFETMGMRLIRGRFLQPSDKENAPVAVVINETMANTYWENEDPIGKRFRQAVSVYSTIVGIVADERGNSAVEEPKPRMYHAFAQYPAHRGFAPAAMTVVLKTAGSPLAVVDAARREIAAIDGDVPVSDIRAMKSVVDEAFSSPRFTTLLLGIFAAVALILAAIGIYGVISYGVTQRTHEIGIRVAVGAGRGDIIRLVVSGGAALTIAGIAIGTLAAVFLTRLMKSLVYGVGTLDPLTFAAVPLTLGAIALIACWIPARRASSVDPLLALRSQ